jgi:hypothetical protein
MAMADHPLLLQRIQYGVETTAGTPVASNKQFVGIDIRPQIREETYEIHATGDQYARGRGLNREWSELAVSGRPSYDEIPILVAMYAGAPTITTPAGATDARQHEFTGVNGTIPTLKTTTIEHGDASRARQIAYVHGRDLTIGSTRAGDGFSVEGTLMGRAVTLGHTLTGSPTALPFVPIEGIDAATYVDTTFAGIGTTMLTRGFNTTFSLSGMTDAFYAKNPAQASFAGTVPTRGEVRATVRLGADSTGEPYAVGYRTGQRLYVREEVTNGVEIDTGVATSEYRFTLDMCLEVLTAGDFDEETGLMVIEPEFAVVNDATAGFAWRLQVVNTQLAL